MQLASSCPALEREFDTIHHIQTVTRLSEVSQEYNLPLCLTFIDLGKAFDTVETEAVSEFLGNQGVATQYIRIFRELYSNFTTRSSPFYDDITIDVRRRVRQGDIVSPKLLTATLEDVMRRLERDNIGVQVDSRTLHQLCYADDIVMTRHRAKAEYFQAVVSLLCGGKDSKRGDSESVESCIDPAERHKKARMG
ncbi:hypothetical protein ANCCEY_03733 [Ancylostoma ceylanicum]|uniref:Reverse transcriptase domain-containing protein n=1 Tax=Ancylostoma ceylanicum TaxID=53326 RepID=A0A0D6MAU7_9BILA|nr:hypothetical protein ANCCEY_03733 [Ancylostoma ceylanicum]